MKQLAVLGSTGSIGTSTLDIVEKNPEEFSVVGLAAGRNVKCLQEQIQKFRPRVVSLAEKTLADDLKSWLRNQKDLGDTRVEYGVDGACAVSCADGVDLVIAGMVGAAGLVPTLEAIRKGTNIGLANKETMVIAGALMTAAARESGAIILPVDSEHNALFQCMHGQDRKEIKRLILTASGGPFLQTPEAKLRDVTPAQALKHPNWDMGAKITIDSATMMNKGLEVIEAHFLFDFPADQIDIVVHPQSIVHSMVEYIDGSVLAQMGIPDMRIPISHALAYPKRLQLDLPRLDLIKAKRLEFFPPDRKRFHAITLAYEALRLGQTMPAVLNAANEVAIPHFLEGHIGFLQIPQTVEAVMESHEKEGLADILNLEGLLQADRWARQTCERIIAH